MKSRLIPILLTCACASVARADFNPITLTANSYTFDIVVESNTVQSLPYCINVTAGNGTGLGDNTYYEQGLHSRPGQSGTNSGVPIHNTVFTNINNANMTFVMPPDYTTNNDLMIDSAFTSGQFNFNANTTATNLAILGCGGGGATTIGWTVTHADTTTESGSTAFPDWFGGGATVAWGANGRITSGGGYNNYNSSAVNNQAPYLYGNTITVSGASAIVSIAFTFTSGAHANLFAVSGKALGATTWSPIPLGGFNVMGLVPAAVPFPVTATMDQGTNLAQNGNLATWFEQGFVRGTPTAGLPPSGSTFNSQSQPTHHYQMGNYSANNGILVDLNHPIVNITPANPTNYGAFSLLTAGGNVGSGKIMTNVCILQHLDGVNETNLFFGYDWFEGSIAPAFIANGRVNMSGRAANNVNNNNPRLFESYFALNDITSPVTNIVVMYQTSPAASSTTFIMAVSASPPFAPVITAGALPATQTWFPTQTATFTVQVSGTAPVTNSWLVEDNGVYVPLTNGVDANGSTVSGAGTTTLTISGLTLADGTNYEYIAANALGSATSNPALLIMNSSTPTAPIIASQTPAVSFSVLTNHFDTTTFSVTMDTNSPPPLFYQWFNGSTAISNATNTSYVNMDTNFATLFCVITNFIGAVTSSPVSIAIYLKPAPSPYQSAIFAYNPVAYWPLNEADGTIAFDYSGTNDGIYTGGCVLGQTGLPATAGIGANTAVTFDGATAYVNIPVGRLNITNALTVIQWVQPPNGGDTGFTTPLGHSDQSYRFDVAGGQPHWADAGPDIVSTTPINDGNWHQLVGVYDGTNESLFVDGQPAGTPHTSAPAGSTANVWIGGAPDYAGARNFNGNIAQVAILTNALTAAQVLAIYNSLDTPPTVTITPASPSIYAGSSVTLTAHLSGTPATKLQWYVIDNSSVSNNIAGATNATYSILNAPLSFNGYTYGIIAANAFGTNTASVILSVQNGPAYLVGDLSPLTGEAYVGAPVTYSVNAQGSLPINYQWTVDGSAVSGATNASYTAPAACGSHTIQVSFTNSQSGGTPVISSLATLQGDAYPTNITFNTDGTAWQLNTFGVGSVPTIVANVLELTDGTGNEASTAFYTVAQYVGSFKASFTYTGNGSADGVAFILQNSSAGVTALGGGGGGLGYYGISNSVAFQINLYPGNGEIPGIIAGTNGNTYGAGGGPAYQPAGPVDVASGNPINVKLNWANGVMAVSLTDTVTLATYSTNYVFGPLTPILGGSDLAYVGFSGGDGGATSIQTISNFEFNSVIPPVTLSVSPLTGSSFVISWPATDPSYVLQKTSSLTAPSWSAGPTPVVVGGVNQATVNVTGGNQQFYRLVRVVCQ